MGIFTIWLFSEPPTWSRNAEPLWYSQVAAQQAGSAGLSVALVTLPSPNAVNKWTLSVSWTQHIFDTNDKKYDLACRVLTIHYFHFLNNHSYAPFTPGIYIYQLVDRAKHRCLGNTLWSGHWNHVWMLSWTHCICNINANEPQAAFEGPHSHTTCNHCAKKML